MRFQSTRKASTYRTVEHVLTFVSALLNVSLEGTRVQWLEQLEAAQQLTRHGHDGSPVVELSTVLYFDVSQQPKPYYIDLLTFGAENTVTKTRSVKNS
jgi:hypothetical protein